MSHFKQTRKKILVQVVGDRLMFGTHGWLSVVLERWAVDQSPALDDGGHTPYCLSQVGTERRLTGRVMSGIVWRGSWVEGHKVGLQTK